MGDLNGEIFHAINGWPDSISPFLTFFSIGMNLIWVKCLLALVLIGMIARNRNTRATAIMALIAVGIGNSLTDLAKALAPMHRPYQDLLDVINRVSTSNSHGTASAHSANMAAVALVFSCNLRWWGAPWVVIAILTGISRVYVGAHYPYQVLNGWACGVASGLLVVIVWDLIQLKRRAVVNKEPANEESQTG